MLSPVRMSFYNLVNIIEETMRKIIKEVTANESKDD